MAQLNITSHNIADVVQQLLEILAERAGTKLPIWASTAINAFWRR